MSNEFITTFSKPANNAVMQKICDNINQFLAQYPLEIKSMEWESETENSIDFNLGIELIMDNDYYLKDIIKVILKTIKSINHTIKAKILNQTVYDGNIYSLELELELPEDSIFYPDFLKKTEKFFNQGRFWKVVKTKLDEIDTKPSNLIVTKTHEDIGHIEFTILTNKNFQDLQLQVSNIIREISSDWSTSFNTPKSNKNKVNTMTTYSFYLDYKGTLPIF